MTKTKDGAGCGLQPCHRWRCRVYYEDTDALGIVYYANYLKFAERGRTEMLRPIREKAGGSMAEAGPFFVVQRCAVDYRRPGRLDDVIEVRTYVLRPGAASLSLKQDIYRDDTLLVSMDVRLAFVSKEMRPARLPKALIAALMPQYKVGN